MFLPPVNIGTECVFIDNIQFAHVPKSIFPSSQSSHQTPVTPVKVSGSFSSLIRTHSVAVFLRALAEIKEPFDEKNLFIKTEDQTWRLQWRRGD